MRNFKIRKVKQEIDIEFIVLILGALTLRYLNLRLTQVDSYQINKC